jgi:hypothetical protein
MPGTTDRLAVEELNRAAEQHFEEAEQAQGRKALSKMLRPCPHLLVIVHDLCPLASPPKQRPIRIQTKVDNRIGDEAEHKYRHNHDEYGENQLSRGTTNQSPPPKPLQPIPISACGTLPVVALAVGRVRVPPGLQTLFVHVLLRALAFAGVEETAAVRAGVGHVGCAGLEDVREILGGRSEDWQDGFQTDAALARLVVALAGRGLSAALAMGFGCLVGIWGWICRRGVLMFGGFTWRFSVAEFGNVIWPRPGAWR